MYIKKSIPSSLETAKAEQPLLTIAAIGTVVINNIV